MEKVDKTYRKQLYPLKIDIKDIHTIIEYLSNFIDAEIIIDDYRIDIPNLEVELAEFPKKIVHSFKIKAWKQYKAEPDFMLNLTKGNAVMVLANEEDNELMGVGARVETFLIKNSKFKIKLNYIPGIISVIFFLFVLLILTDSLSLSKPIVVWLVVILILLVIVSLTISARIYNYDYCTIHLEEFKKQPNFLKRNKDKIFVGLIVGIIVGVISAFFTWLFTTKPCP